jgi:hypothetical protein
MTMDEQADFLGFWTSIDRSVGGIDLDVRRSGKAFTVQRFEPWGTPIGLPVHAVADGPALVAVDLGDDEAGMIVFTLADSGATLELHMPDTERPIRFRRMYKGERPGDGRSSHG